MSYRAHGFDTCGTCGADLWDGASYCPECGAPQRDAARARRNELQPGPRRPWMAVALVAAGLVAVFGGAAVAMLMSGSDTTASDRNGAVSGSASASPSAAATSSPAAAVPTDSGTPEPSASPTPPAVAVIPNRGIATVTTDSLNLRSGPGQSSNLITTLQADRRLFVIGDATEVDGLRWYRVALVSDAACESDCDLIGFVATPVPEADVWIKQVEIGCPASPMTDADLGALHPLEALHCYGRTEIVVTGTVAHPCCGYVGPFAFSPEWLAHPQTAGFLSTSGLGFRPHPDAHLDVPERGDVVRVTGHFEDPASPSCRVSVDDSFWGDASPEPVQLPDPARVVLDCRATFVWTGYQVTGHEDLGPCCGALPTDGGTAWLIRSIESW